MDISNLEQITITYFDKKIVINNNLNIEKLPTGVAQFSMIGKELATICDSQPINKFLDYVVKQWESYIPKENIEIKQND